MAEVTNELMYECWESSIIAWINSKPEWVKSSTRSSR